MMRARARPGACARVSGGNGGRRPYDGTQSPAVCRRIGSRSITVDVGRRRLFMAQRRVYKGLRAGGFRGVERQQPDHSLRNPSP